MAEYAVDLLKMRLGEAMVRLTECDLELLVLNVSERCVSHRLALHLQELFPELNVDCKYNRDGPSLKELDPPKDPLYWDDDEAKSVFPDIVVHLRNRADRNVLVIEMKKAATGSLVDFDRDKLTAFTGEYYRYTLGALVVFGTGDAAGRWSIEWFPGY